jgi:serine/threonine protein kinase
LTTLSSGTKLGQYEVVECVGVGGMGEVYRARDTKLGRDVAIKVLPEAFSQDKERLERFEREARLLAQLNHPNIATLHGLEEHEGQQFLIMELVEGETLAERIAKGPLSVKEAISLFTQIADGLEAAHEKGIVHRDLKPANIKITPEGRIKILDFGLAKAFSPEDSVSAATSQSPTLTKGTALGAIMGTASYMSPEQATGRPVDRRTDVWAFGCCLYEALSGKKAFDGETATDAIAAVVKSEPDWAALPSTLPSRLREVLERCLTKERNERLRDAGDAIYELRASGRQETPQRSRRAARGVFRLVVAVFFFFFISGIAARNQ